ncbi:unnamed protein product [Nippostrongylus brasiliensis]|uniref:EGF-like domain-containing protein n=1 Tax=Nippostrongylus brasiliensis TaxID=27835 RepID=A0A0N4YQB8_NIPBR|nr:unnamed protein product [Nippostrongylus brasiliensis]
MTFTVHSVDRSFCVDRCNELGVCYASREGPICYCDDGRIGGSCGSESFTTPSPPPSSNNYLSCGDRRSALCYWVVREEAGSLVYDSGDIDRERVGVVVGQSGAIGSCSGG